MEPTYEMEGAVTAGTEGATPVAPDVAQDPAEGIQLPGRSPVPPRKQKRRSGRLPRHLRWPTLSVEQVIEWADRHYARTGAGPTSNRGAVIDAPREKWSNLDNALRAGMRGLPAGLSVARLLAVHRGARNPGALPPYTTQQILEWADAHFRRTGQWPTADSGPVTAAPSETWEGIDAALRVGVRGLPRGSSLARLLAEQRGRRNHLRLPLLTEAQILAWADAFHARTGLWPVATSGEIPEAPGETWSAVNSDLNNGRRGLPGGATLARLLGEHRQVRSPKAFPPLAEEMILRWADAHYARTGAWPKAHSGSIGESPADTWQAVDQALFHGSRGLPGGWTLARLLLERRGVVHKRALPRLTEDLILAWADTYRERHGRWPTQGSGAVDGASTETWGQLDLALRHGYRGLPEGDSLPRLLARRRGAQNRTNKAALTEALILRWADAHYASHGRYPQIHSGAVDTAPGENWSALNAALQCGSRGLPGGSSLAKMLAEQRGVPLRGRGRLTGPVLQRAGK